MTLYGENRADTPLALIVDPEGDVYVTGLFGRVDTAGDCVTLKLDSNGNQLWAINYDRPGKRSNETPSGLVVDDDGNVYVTGEYRTVLANEPAADCVTLKYDSEGNECWVVVYDGPDGGFDGAADLSVDQDGNVYIVGTSVESMLNGADSDFLRACPSRR